VHLLVRKTLILSKCTVLQQKPNIAYKGFWLFTMLLMSYNWNDAENYTTNYIFDHETIITKILGTNYGSASLKTYMEKKTVNRVLSFLNVANYSVTEFLSTVVTITYRPITYVNIRIIQIKSTEFS
jgi:hypothetical protein